MLKQQKSRPRSSDRVTTLILAKHVTFTFKNSGSGDNLQTVSIAKRE